MPIRKALADNIRYYRMALGLSQEQLSERCGMCRTYVGSIEQLKANVCLENIERIAEALDVDPMLLFLADPPFEPIKNVRVARRHPPKLGRVVAVCEWNEGKPSMQVATTSNADELSRIVYRVIENPNDEDEEADA